VSSAGPCPYSARLPRERLIRCLQYYFREWNPGAPIGVIDWEGLADSSLTLAENLERFEREYPVFRWRPEEPEERARREILDEVARSIEAALNAGYRPSDIARNLREALLKRGLTERQIQGILGALNLPEQPPAQPQPPPQAPPPPAQPPQPRPRRPSEREIEAVLRRLEARLGHPLRVSEYWRFTVECAERAETLEDLEECADRLYEEFSKRPLQLPAPKPQPEEKRPEEGALVRGGEAEAPPLPRQAAVRGGPRLPVVRRSARPLQLLPEERPVIVVVTPAGNIKCFWEKSYEDARDFAAYMRSRGGRVLCLGPIEACEEYAEYCGRRPVT